MSNGNGIAIALQIEWMRDEMKRTAARLTRAMSSGRMRPAVAEHIQSHQRAILATLQDVQARQGPPVPTAPPPPSREPEPPVIEETGDA